MAGPRAGQEISLSAFAEVLHLFPGSGVQTFEIDIPTSCLIGTYDLFIEDKLEVGTETAPVLVSLGPRIANDGIVWHPVTKRPLSPQEILAPTGEQAVAAFMGSWIPLPYLRYLGRDDAGNLRVDEGPSNWVRLFLVPPSGSLRMAKNVKAVIAFDTAVTETSRLDLARYLQPTVEDAGLMATFVLATTSKQLKPVVGEVWVTRWLTTVFRPEPLAHGARTFHHEALARYLTLLRVLSAAGQLPSVRFNDTVSRRRPQKSVSMDLVVDVGGAETAALLVSPRDAGRRHSAVPLKLHNLAHPTRTYSDRIPTVLEFDHAPFGDVALSRASGRPTAFAWPSPARIGMEARHLALRANSADGVTGLSELKSHLVDVAPSMGVWRASLDGDEYGRLGPMVAGPSMAVLVDGTMITDASRPAPVTTQRFSRSALMSFFLAELLLHALAQLNAPDRSASAAVDIAPRILSRVVLTTNLSTPEAERELLLTRARSAVDMIWSDLAASGASTPILESKPEVVLGAGLDLGAQILFLTNEVRGSFNGDYEHFQRLISREEVAHAGSQELRIASLELGEATSSLLIADYKQSAAGRTKPHVVAVERWSHGTRHLVQGVATQLIVPALVQSLEGCGLRPARRFVDTLLGRAAGSLVIDDPMFATRLERKVLRPAASALLELYAAGSLGLGDGFKQVLLTDLVAHGEGRVPPLDKLLDVAAARAGAQQFALSRVKVTFAAPEVAAVVRQDYDEVFRALGAMLKTHRCDLLLLHGPGARNPAIVAGLRDLHELSVNRLVVLPDVELAEGQDGDSGRPDSGSGAIGGITGILSAYLAGRSTEKEAAEPATLMRVAADRS